MITLTQELENQFKEHSTDNIKECLWDNEIIASFHNLKGSGIWLIISAEPIGDDWQLFGYCCCSNWEWGSVSLKELMHLNPEYADLCYVQYSPIMTVGQFKDKFLLDSITKLPYETFCSLFEEYIQIIQDSEKKRALVKGHKVDKINYTYDAVFYPIADNQAVTVNLNEVYEHYSTHNISFIEIINNTLGNLKNLPQLQVQKILDLGTEYIKGVLVNTEVNASILEKCPNRAFLDLSIVYYYDFEDKSVLITNDLLKNKNLTENDLYTFAMQQLKTCQVHSLSDLLDIDLDTDDTMVCVTNLEKYRGNLGILSENIVKYAEHCEDDLYLIPSSIHEWLVLPTRSCPLEFIKEIHTEQVKLLPKSEFVSNNIYRLSKDTGKITIVD